jgi:CheY-like chemotaxis protein
MKDGFESKPMNQSNVLVIEDDLFFSVRIETVLQKMGYAVTVIGDHVKALEHARQHKPALVIINFGSDRLAPADTTRHLKELPDPPPVMGFVPHVWMPQVRPSAMAAGCDLLVANSALVMRLPQLVGKLLAKQDLTDGQESC